MNVCPCPSSNIIPFVASYSLAIKDAVVVLPPPVRTNKCIGLATFQVKAYLVQYFFAIGILKMILLQNEDMKCLFHILDSSIT